MFHARVATVLLIVFACPLSAGEGAGAAAGKKSLGGSGQMIQVDMTGDSQMLAGIETHGSRYGSPAPPDEKFLIYVLDESQAKIIATEMAPYSLFERDEERWVTVNFEKPITVPKGSWLVLDFRAGRTKGVYVSYDNVGDRKRSKVGLPGIAAKDVDFDGNWMIRPITAK